MAGLDDELDEQGTAVCALLYHRPHPCANPGEGVMMNKQQAIGVRAKSWLIDWTAIAF
jgi:hypothetical protein